MAQRAKLALFADDLLLFLTKLDISLPNVVAKFQHLGNLSNFKVNASKPEISNVFLPARLGTQLQREFPLKVRSDHITYLGTHIPTDLSSLYRLDYLKILMEASKRCDALETHLHLMVWPC